MDLLTFATTNSVDRVSGNDDDTDSTNIIAATTAGEDIVWTTARCAPASTNIVRYPVYRACHENLTSTYDAFLFSQPIARYQF